MSTNERLSLVLNNPDYDEEDDERTKNEKADKIKQKVRRAVLYGSGTKAKFPVVKNEVDSSKSALFINSSDAEIGAKSKDTMTTDPPGSHEDQYRVIRNHTSFADSDPEKIWYTTSSVTDGLRVLQQPPWYVGRQNKVRPPDISILTSAARYGYRGSKELRQYLTEPYMTPARTRTEYTPEFLNTEYLRNEWVPPITASPLTDGYQLTTPKLWPESTLCPTSAIGGSRNEALKPPTSSIRKPATSSLYRNQTTSVHDEYEPHLYAKSFKKLELRMVEEEHQLVNLSHMEKSKKVLSRPQSQQIGFRSTWDSQLLKSASTTLKNTQMYPDPKLHSKTRHSLNNTTDSLRYGSSSSLILQAQSSEMIKLKSKIESQNSLLPFSLRWKLINHLIRVLNTKFYKFKLLLKAVRDTITYQLKLASVYLNGFVSISRKLFIDVLRNTELFEAVSDSELSMLFSAFDPIQTGFIRLSEFLSQLLLLVNSPTEPLNALTKIQMLWELYDLLRDDSVRPIDRCESIILSVVNTPLEYELLSSLFKAQFRPKCYTICTLSGPIPEFPSDTLPQDSEDASVTTISQHSIDARAFNFGQPSTAPPTPMKSYSHRSSVSVDTNSTSTASFGGAFLLPESNNIRSGATGLSAAVPTQFNVTDKYLTLEVMTKVLLNCSDLLQEFENCMCARIRECSDSDSDPRGGEIAMASSDMSFTGFGRGPK